MNVNKMQQWMKAAADKKAAESKKTKEMNVNRYFHFFKCFPRTVELFCWHGEGGKGLFLKRGWGLQPQGLLS